MLTTKQFSIAVACTVILSSILLTVSSMTIAYPVQLMVLGNILVGVNVINAVMIKNEAANLVFNIVISIIASASILIIIGWL
ncbi:TPA: hypothetical protein PC505_003932 [Morganella morganii]|nr:hypothetical protein [Morganella morganii]HDF2424477.1 hypothetical protein [Morganella morganii]